MPFVGELLAAATERLRGSGSETPRLDAELLLGHAIGTDRTTLIAHPEASVGPEANARLDLALERRSRGEPVAYIRELKEFFGLAFVVDARALIPRPETERLVEAAMAEVIARLAVRKSGSPPIAIADVGTGSGAVAVALAVALARRRVRLDEDVRILATDVSPAALDLARENAVGHAVADGISFMEADLLPPLLPDDARLDVIAANLPYVRSDAIAGLPVATSFEPRLALDGGVDGLAVIGRALELLPDLLAEDGVALFEIGGDQGDSCAAAVSASLPGWQSGVERDLAGLPRVLRVSRT